MHRIDDPTASPTLPAPRPQGTPGYFTGGSPGSGGFAATVVRYEFMNALQEEISAVVEAAALTLNKTDNNQLLEALRQMLRFKLTQDTTIYVSPTGNDNNDGLTQATALATGQAAWDLALTLDLNNHNLILQFAHGTYTNPIVCSGVPMGIGPAKNNVVILGDMTSPGSVIFHTTNADCVSADAGGVIVVQGVTLTTTSGGNCVSAGSAGLVSLGGSIIFGACAGMHMFAGFGTVWGGGSPYTINGGAIAHMYAQSAGYCENVNASVSITSTPNFSQAFAVATAHAMVESYGVAYAGTATGPRYLVNMGAQISTQGGGANYLPGNAAGTADASTFGLYS